MQAHAINLNADGAAALTGCQGMKSGASRISAPARTSSTATTASGRAMATAVRRIHFGARGHPRRGRKNMSASSPASATIPTS